MQIIFLSKQNPKDYVEKEGRGKYPNAPKKCPFKDCGINLKMKKHGFYRRYLATLRFQGCIRVRRYRCPKCGQTVSMLPSFCIPRVSYGVLLVVMMLRYAHIAGSIRKTAKTFCAYIGGITRRLIGKYLTRLRNNRRLIQYGINQLSPDNIALGRLSGDAEWTKSFLDGIRPHFCLEFNVVFHKITEKSFMSLQNTIAQPGNKIQVF